MTVISKTGTVGLDAKFLLIQNYLDDKLSWANTTYYGKLQETQENGNTVLSVIEGKKYYQPFFDDTKNASVGFLIKNRESLNSVNVDVIVTMKLGTIYSGEYQEDQRAIEDFKRALFESALTITINEVKEGNSEVFSGFVSEPQRDKYPYMVFAINCNIRYNAPQ